MLIPTVIVDDNQTDRYMLRRRLLRDGSFEVFEAHSGMDFLEKYFASRGNVQCFTGPLLVLMDINMPRINGFQTIEKMIELSARGDGPRPFVVVMCTTSDNSDDRARASGLDHVGGYVVKPATGEDITWVREIYRSQVT